MVVDFYSQRFRTAIETRVTFEISIPILFLNVTLIRIAIPFIKLRLKFENVERKVFTVFNDHAILILRYVCLSVVKPIYSIRRESKMHG